MKPSTDSYGYGARNATRNAWSLLVANGVDSARAVGHVAWPRAQPFW
jgi:hypothetical protein